MLQGENIWPCFGDDQCLASDRFILKIKLKIVAEPFSKPVFVLFETNLNIKLRDMLKTTLMKGKSKLDSGGAKVKSNIHSVEHVKC